MPVHADTRQHALNEGELVGFQSDRLPLQPAAGLRRCPRVDFPPMALQDLGPGWWQRLFRRRTVKNQDGVPYRRCAEAATR